MRKIDDSGPKKESELKSVRQIRVRYSDIEGKRPDPFMRHCIIKSNLGQIRIGSDNEVDLARIFVDTGANCNTISRKYSTLLDQGPKCRFYPGGIDINLVGGQRLKVLGDKITFMTEVKLREVFIPNKNF